MARMVLGKVTSEGYMAVSALQKYVQANVESSLHELIKTRASQINGCAYCVDMHTHDARAGGETEQRLYALSAWREAPFFSDRERAALALTEAITRIADHRHVPDDIWDEAAAQFSQRELADLVLAIAQINTWNRIAISTGMQPKLREE